MTVDVIEGTDAYENATGLLLAEGWFDAVTQEAWGTYEGTIQRDH